MEHAVAAPAVGQHPRDRASSPGAVALAVRLVAAVVAVAVAAGGAALAFSRPRPPGYGEADLVSMIVAAVLNLVATTAAIATLGHLVAAVWLTARSRRGAEPDSARRWAGAHRWALVWLISAVLLVPAASATITGVPLRYAIGAPATFVASVPLGSMWVVVALGALVVVIITARQRSWATGVGLTVIIPVLLLGPVVTDRVSSGAGHDFATDLATIVTLAVIVWFAVVWARGGWSGAVPAAVTRRVRIATVVGIAVVVPLRMIIAGYELAGTRPTAGAYGQALIMLIAGFAVVAGVVLLAARSGGPLAWSLARGALIVVLGVRAALTQLFPPRFWVPQSTLQNYLGFELTTAPDLNTMLVPGRPNLLLMALAAIAVVGYLAGYLRLRLRGDRWPITRVLAWLAGWLVVAGVGASRVWAYSTAMFSWHMVAHMVLNMIAPPLLALGGPLTLALQALHPARGLPGPREAIVTMLHARLGRILSQPIVLLVAFVGSFYLLYFTPLFAAAMRYHWAHQLMVLHFIAIGYFFYAVAIGVDRPVRDLPPIARLAIVFAAMPFHAFFAIAVMASDLVIGGRFFRVLDLPWHPDLAADNQAGGQIAWAVGELSLLIVIVALVVQWFRQDQRFAARRERAVVGGVADELAAYNDMLAAIAERDGGRSRQP